MDSLNELLNPIEIDRVRNAAVPLQRTADYQPTGTGLDQVGDIIGCHTTSHEDRGSCRTTHGSQSGDIRGIPCGLSGYDDRIRVPAFHKIFRLYVDGPHCQRRRVLHVDIRQNSNVLTA